MPPDREKRTIAGSVAHCQETPPACRLRDEVLRELLRVIGRVACARVFISRNFLTGQGV